MPAHQSIESGLYVTWIPQNTADIVNPEVRQRYEAQHTQCCRVAMEAPCLCGHSLSDHKAVNPRSKGFILPPKCTKKGCSCFRYNYAPGRPEETGQWWLPRRKDFNLSSWRKRVQQNPEEYSCIGCDLKVSDHETCFETRKQRAQRGALIDESYIPLQDCPELQEVVLDGKAEVRSQDNDFMRIRPMTKKTATGAGSGKGTEAVSRYATLTDGT